MMRDTPRTFIGPLVLLLRGPVDVRDADAISAGIGGIPGIGRCDLDVDAGTLTVTAEAPVDRTDVLAALERLGCRVRS
jgi:hypothetical protein